MSTPTTLMHCLEQMPATHLAAVFDLINILHSYPETEQALTLISAVENLAALQEQFLQHQRDMRDWHRTFLKQRAEIEQYRAQLEYQRTQLHRLEETLIEQRQEMLSARKETQYLRQLVYRNREDLESLRKWMKEELERMEKQYLMIEIQHATMIDNEKYRRNQLN